MDISDAQREMRTRFVGGFYGQLVSGMLWIVAAALATWSSPRAGITTLVVGGLCGDWPGDRCARADDDAAALTNALPTMSGFADGFR